jgi:CubicO group peptidase (beta-lactamase class C family)
MSYNFRINCLTFSFFACFLLMFQLVSAQPDFSSVNSYFDGKKGLFGGNSVVLVWQNDKIVYQKLNGEFNLTTQMPAGAASQWFTAALTLYFVEQGKISLDDPVSKYLPIYSKYAKSYLTIRHCLAHLTGLQSEKGGVQKLFQKTKFPSLEEEVNSFASSREIVNNPGLEFNFNNMGPNIVGRVLEIVGKKSFDRLMLERIFRPLGMKRSTFVSETAVNPAAGAQTSAGDMIRFLAMLLNKGTLAGKKILSEESVAEMMKIQTGNAKTVFVPTAAQGYAHGLGCWLEDSEQSGKNNIAVAPGLFGSWPYIDTCRNYAAVIFTKQQSKEEKREPYLEIRNAIQDALGECRK